MGYLNVFEQSQEQFLANALAVDTRLEAEGLKLVANDINSALVTNYLLKHNKKASGLVDATPKTMYAAIAALKTELDWVEGKGPGKTKTSWTENGNPLTWAQREAQAPDPVETAALEAKRADEAEGDRIMAAAYDVIKKFRRATHGRTEGGRETLLNEWTQQLKGVRKDNVVPSAQARKIFATIKTLAEALP